MIQFDSFDSRGRSGCAACEAILVDAVDGLLDPAEEARFQAHLLTCTRCTQLFAEAERGASWLLLLKAEQQPALREYRTDLVSRILSQTTGQTGGRLNPSVQSPATPVFGAPVFGAPVIEPPGTPLAAWPVPSASAAQLPAVAPLPWRPARPAAVPVWRTVGRVLLEPRLAMTAAMAFFSIALTLSLTGVQLQNLHASDLNPLNLRRTLYQDKAGAVRYYDSLQVVHVLESRVDDLRLRTTDEDRKPAEPTPHPAPGAPGREQNTPKQPGPGASRAPLPETGPDSGLNPRLNHEPRPLERTAHQAADQARIPTQSLMSLVVLPSSHAETPVASHGHLEGGLA